MWSFRKEIHKLTPIYAEPNLCVNGMDVAFLVDYTASMGTVIDSVKSSIAAIIANIEAQVGLSDYRLGLVISDEESAGDPLNYGGVAAYTSLPAGQKDVDTTGITDKYTTALEMFSLNNEASFSSQVAILNTPSLPLGDGVEGAEPLDIGIDLILNSAFLNPLRGGSIAKFILVFTDNEPGGDDGVGTIAAKMASLTADCISQGVKVIVFGDGALYTLWQDIATGTGGAYTTDYSESSVIAQINNGC